MTSDVPNMQMIGALHLMSRDEAALYGTPQARRDEDALRAATKGDVAEAIEIMEWMAADYEKARESILECCANGIAACKQAIEILKGIKES